MSGLFVKLDAEYPTDDEFIEAGPMAELLFIRALCFCKRKMLDGTISERQLVSVASNIPNPRKHAATLVAVGLWETTDDGWFITSWFKRNKSAAQIAEDKEMRRVASMEANHIQHHVGPGKKRSPKCELCRSEMSPISAPISEGDRTRNRLQEPKPEPQEEPEPEEESFVGHVLGFHPVLSGARDDDERISEAINTHARVTAMFKAEPGGESGYAIAVAAEKLSTRYSDLCAWLDRNPDCTADDLAIAVLRTPEHHLAAYRAKEAS